MSFVQLLLQTAIVYLNISRLAFLMDTNCVLCEVGPECYIVINFRVNTANSLMAITKKRSLVLIIGAIRIVTATFSPHILKATK